MVPMSDGVKLATLVYLPAGQCLGAVPRRVPSHAVRHRAHRSRESWPYAARVLLFYPLDCRGTWSLDPQHRSEGVWEENS